MSELRENLDERFDLVDFWNKEKGRQKWLNRRNINWEKAKVVCISPSFHPHEFSEKEAILIEIEKYENNIYVLTGKTEQLELLGIKKLFNKKEPGEKEKLNENGSKKQITSLSVENIYIEKFLLEREIKEPKIKQLVLEINNFLRSYSLKEVTLITGASSKSSWYIKYSRNKNAVLSLVPQQKYITVYLNKLTNNDFSLRLIKKYELKDYRGIGHNGDLGNDWQYMVNNENSFQQIFDLLASYCEELVNKPL